MKKPLIKKIHYGFLFVFQTGVKFIFIITPHYCVTNGLMHILCEKGLLGLKIILKQKPHDFSSTQMKTT